MLAMNNATCSRIAERPYDTRKQTMNLRKITADRSDLRSKSADSECLQKLRKAIRSIILLVYFDFDLLSTGNL